MRCWSRQGVCGSEAFSRGNTAKAELRAHAGAVLLHFLFSSLQLFERWITSEVATGAVSLGERFGLRICCVYIHLNDLT
jgi:hypothetical protein